MISKKINQRNIFHQISELLESRAGDTQPDSIDRTRASVAMILCQTESDLEMLFIQRSANDSDPWSGHIAFPGGKLEDGELVCQAARRETWEEIGIDLERECYLGRLSDIVGTNLPVRVSCCVFRMDRAAFVPSLSEEVDDVFWTSVSDLRDRDRHLLTKVAFDDQKFEVPAIRLPSDGKPVLWGITYRLAIQFLELLKQLDSGAANAEDPSIFPATMELDEVT